MSLKNLLRLAFIYGIFVVTIHGEFDDILAKLRPSSNEQNIKCTVGLLRKYFQVHEPLSGYVLSIKLTSQEIDAQEDLIKAMQSDTTYPWTIILLSNSFFSDARRDHIELAEKPILYLYLTDLAVDLNDVLDMWKSTSNWNPNAQYVLYSPYVEENLEELTELVTDIVARILRTQKFYNIFIICETSEENTVYGLTMFPYHPLNSCAKFIQKINIVDSCIASKTSSIVTEIQSASFADKYPNDLNGCPLFVAYRPREPYIFRDMDNYANDSDHIQEDLQMNGLEYRLLRTIGKVLNLRIVFLKEIKHLYLLYQAIIDSEVDLIIGGIDENPKLSGYVSSAVPHYQDDLTLCVAKGKPTNNLKDLLSTMNIIAFVLLILMLLLMSFCLVMSQKLLEVHVIQLIDLKITFIRMFGVSFGQSLPLGRIPSSIQFLLASSFYMGLLLTNIFQGVLVSILTADRNIDQVSRLQDIHERSIHVMGDVQILDFLDKDDKVYESIRKNFKICHDIDVCLRNAADDSQLAVAVPREHATYNPRIARDRLYCFDRQENIYSYLVAMSLPKNFHLLYKINPIIYNLIESGLLYKWAEDMRNTGQQVQSFKTNEPQQLTLQDVKAFGAVGLFCLGFSSMIFILEITTHYLVVRRNTRIQIFIFLHKTLFTPKTHSN